MKRVSRERASERRSREGPAKGQALVSFPICGMSVVSGVEMKFYERWLQALPPPPAVASRVSSRVPLARVLFMISPKQESLLAGYDVIGDNVFHGKIMRFHLVKRSFHIYYTTWVRACSRSFFRDSAMNSYTLPSTVSFYHIFSHTVLSFTTVCALFVGITLFLSQYYLLYCEK